jgi:predicted histidine transporter YuiF (NhaC family)
MGIFSGTRRVRTAYHHHHQQRGKTMNETVGMRMMNAKIQRLTREKTARAAAMHRFNSQIKRQKNNKIAAAMIALIILVIANTWAAAQGWGL